MTFDSIQAEPHPLLDARAFITEFPGPLGSLEVPLEILDLMRLDAAAPFTSTDAIRADVRNLLRHGGFKPTGRSKPASEYLLRAVEEQRLTPINLAVDLCNVVSLHTGLPISVVDLAQLTPPIRIAIAPIESSYVFNPTGQVLDLAGLLCLWDAAGPCANGVKDAQRTKTTPKTTRTLSVVWGSRSLFGLSAATAKWYQELVTSSGGRVHNVSVSDGSAA